jgi:hypothetical protein
MICVLIAQYNTYLTMSKQFALENYYFLEQLPIVRDLMKQNEKLKRKNKELKHMVRAFSMNMALIGGTGKEKRFKREKSSETDENVPIDVDVVCVKTENDDVVIINPPTKNNIVYEISETIQLDVIEAEEEEEAVEEEPEGVRGNESPAVEDTVEEEEEAVEEEEEAVEEEEEAVEEEEEAVEEEETADEEVYEVIIKGKTYYTTNEKNGVIYGVDKDGDVSEEVGVYVDGKPTFNK